MRKGDIVKFSDLHFGQWFKTPALNSVCMKIPTTLDATADNAIGLDGWLFHFKQEKEVIFLANTYEDLVMDELNKSET